MKSFFLCSGILSTLVSFGLKAEVSRSPAVVRQCDLDIATTKIQEGSEKVFTSTITHQVIIRSNDEQGCSALPKKRYADSIYEENARNEMKILFQKYADSYSQKCSDHFKRLGLKNSDFACDTPQIVSMTFSGHGCEKKFEDDTRKVSYMGTTTATIKYNQVGKKFEEKPVELVQKEQCERINECIEVASENEMPELKKLSAVACKAELAPVTSGRAPAIERDSSFDGNRKPKTNPNKEDRQKYPEASSSVLK